MQSRSLRALLHLFLGRKQNKFRVHQCDYSTSVITGSTFMLEIQVSNSVRKSDIVLTGSLIDHTEMFSVAMFTSS